MRVALFIICAVFASGCHTIRPAAVSDESYLRGIPKSSQKVLLVLDEDYCGYVSHDRGNSAADPQTYRIGESLEPLSESFFREAYSQVDVAGQMPVTLDPRKWDFIIRPRVEFFSNNLEISLKQEINIGLSADIFDSQLERISSVASTGQSHGSIGVAAVVWGSTKKSGQIVSLALQDALQAVVKEAVAKTG